LPLAYSQSGAEDVRDFTQQEDYALISDLRKYQPTDGYKRIHWKVSAKKNELVSKNFQSTKRNTAALIIDNSKIYDGGLALFDIDGALALEDAMMEAYVSVLAQCARRGQVCNLFYLGNEVSGNYTAEFEDLYDASCSIKFGEYESAYFNEYITNFSLMQVDTDNLILFVKEISSIVFNAASVLRMYGNNVIVFYFRQGRSRDQQERIDRLHEMDVVTIGYGLGNLR